MDDCERVQYSDNGCNDNIVSCDINDIYYITDKLKCDDYISCCSIIKTIPENKDYCLR